MAGAGDHPRPGAPRPRPRRHLGGDGEAGARLDRASFPRRPHPAADGAARRRGGFVGAPRPRAGDRSGPPRGTGGGEERARGEAGREPPSLDPQLPPHHLRSPPAVRLQRRGLERRRHGDRRLPRGDRPQLRAAPLAGADAGRPADDRRRHAGAGGRARRRSEDGDVRAARPPRPARLRLPLRPPAGAGEGSRSAVSRDHGAGRDHRHRARRDAGWARRRPHDRARAPDAGEPLRGHGAGGGSGLAVHDSRARRRGAPRVAAAGLPFRDRRQGARRRPHPAASARLPRRHPGRRLDDRRDAPEPPPPYRPGAARETRRRGHRPAGEPRGGLGGAHRSPQLPCHVERDLRSRRGARRPHGAARQPDRHRRAARRRRRRPPHPPQGPRRPEGRRPALVGEGRGAPRLPPARVELRRLPARPSRGARGAGGRRRSGRRLLLRAGRHARRRAGGRNDPGRPLPDRRPDGGRAAGRARRGASRARGPQRRRRPRLPAPRQRHRGHAGADRLAGLPPSLSHQASLAGARGSGGPRRQRRSRARPPHARRAAHGGSPRDPGEALREPGQRPGDP